MSAADPWGSTARDRLLATALLPGVAFDRAVPARLAHLDADPADPPPDLSPSVRAAWSRAVADPRFPALVAAERRALDRLGAWWLTPLDPDWPPGLPPLGVLRGLGRLPRAGLAIVGARRADGYGLDITRRVARAAVERGFAVISGGAFGVDHAAHRAALDAGGDTVVVLGSGLAHPSPAAHRALFDAAIARGALVSPFACARTAARWTFPKRNAWIAGLASAVVVAQAGARSGALHTARAALAAGQPVYAAPGPMDAPLHAGCHALLAEGARVLTAPDAWAAAAPAPAPAPADETLEPPEHTALWRAAGAEPRPLAELAEAAGLPIAAAAGAATLLELDGWLRAAPGGRYARATSNRRPA